MGGESGGGGGWAAAYSVFEPAGAAGRGEAFRKIMKLARPSTDGENVGSVMPRGSLCARFGYFAIAALCAVGREPDIGQFDQYRGPLELTN